MYGGQDYLMVIDNFSKWIEVFKISHKTAVEVIKYFKIIISGHGCPKIMYADNQPFSSWELRKFAKII